jgi:hypothetical protein
MKSGTRPFSKRGRYLAAALVGTAAALALLPGTTERVARADSTATPTTFTAFNCIGLNGGQKTVPAGSTVVIRQAFVDPRPGVLTSFIGAQTTLISVNDAQMIDVSNQWPEPVQGPDGNYRITLAVSTGVTLANPGDQMRYTFSVTIAKTIAPNPGDPSTLGKPGLVFGGTCTVTAT